MKKSEEIKNLAAGLAKFNSEVSSISKDAKNPFFKSEYVSLDKLIVATRDILQKNGLSVLQFPLSREITLANGNVITEVGIQTMLLHESGEYIETEPLFMLPAKQDPQGAGSLITYLRRYSYQSVLNLNTGQDDDNNYMSNKTINPEEYDKYTNGHGDNNYGNYNNNGKPSDKQLKVIWGKAKGNGISNETVNYLIGTLYKVASQNELTMDQYKDFLLLLDSKKFPMVPEQADSLKTLMAKLELTKDTIKPFVKEATGEEKSSKDLTYEETNKLLFILKSKAS